MQNEITKAIARIENAAGLAQVFNNNGLRGVKFFNGGKFFYAVFSQADSASVDMRFYQKGAGVDILRANESSLLDSKLSGCIHAFTNKVVASI